MQAENGELNKKGGRVPVSGVRANEPGIKMADEGVCQPGHCIK